MALRIRRHLAAGLGLALVPVIAALAPASASAGRDTTPPPSPQHLQITYVDFASVGLSWVDVFDNDSAVTYEVSISDRSRTETAAGARHSFHDLRSETAYTVSVRAVDRAGNRSEPASISLRTPARPPGPPSKPANLRAVLVNGALDSLAWDASTGATQVSYQVYTGPDDLGGAWATWSTQVTAEELITIACLDRGGTYTFTVKAFAAGRWISEHSAALTVTLP